MRSDPFQGYHGLVRWDSLTGPEQEYVRNLEHIAEQAKKMVVWSRQDAMKTGMQRDNHAEIIREMANLLGM